MRWILPLASRSPRPLSARARRARRPEAVLEAAFANRYEVDMISEMEIVMRDRGGSEQRRLVQAVSKRIDGRSQSIGRVLEPASLRGLTRVHLRGRGRRPRHVRVSAGAVARAPRERHPAARLVSRQRSHLRGLRAPARGGLLGRAAAARRRGRRALHDAPRAAARSARLRRGGARGGARPRDPRVPLFRARRDRRPTA